MIKALIKQTYGRFQRLNASRKGSAAYWTVHMVAHDTFQTAEESLSHFHWRNAQYPGYIELMPVSGQNNNVVLDYGCGPGNDLVGFTEFSNPSKLYAVDVSETALKAAQRRLALHGKKAEFIQIEESANEIPVPSESIDYIHTSGVLHHCANLKVVLKEFRRILKPDGKVAVMVYNYESIWLHLYVAYIWQLNLGKYSNSPVLEAFRRSTDGENCPISHCYAPNQFLEICNNSGFDGGFSGSSISLTELKCLERRFDAISDKRLPSEHRDFLCNLSFDDRGIPLYDGSVAGIGGCYSLRKINS